MTGSGHGTPPPDYVLKMLGQKELPPRQDIDNVAQVLLGHLPNLDVGSAPSVANMVIWTRDTAKDVYLGQEDIEGLGELASLAHQYKGAVEKLSEPQKRLLQLEMDSRLFEVGPIRADRLPYGVSAVDAFGNVLKLVATIAKAQVADGMPKGRTTWSAVVTVDLARDLWWQDRREHAPRSTKGGASLPPFEQFLDELFEALRIGMQPGSAINAWRRWVDS